MPQAQRESELERFRKAAEAVATRLTERAAHGAGAAAEVLTATAALARDKGLMAAVEQRVKAGTAAGEATVAAAEQFADLFRQMGGLMAERVTDLLDVRDRLIAQVTGLPEPGIPRPSEPSVLLAEDLAPADTAGLDPSLSWRSRPAWAARPATPRSSRGSSASPASWRSPGWTTSRPARQSSSTARPAKSSPTPTRVAASARRGARRRREAVAGWSGPGRTADGHEVQVLANVQDGAGARKAATAPAEGVGLFRTELCFLDRDVEPTVEEQADIYAEVLEAFAGRKVVLRTLDAGSDKPLASSA